MDDDFDIASAVTSIGDDLFGGEEAEADDPISSPPAADPPPAAPSGEETPAAAPAVAAPVPPAGAPAVTAPAPLPGQLDITQPPTTWTAEAKALWGQLDPRLQGEVAKREADMFRGIEALKPDANFGKEMKAALQEFEAPMQQYGLNPAQLVPSLMRAHHILSLGDPQTKTALFQKLAADYQIDLFAVMGQENPNAPYVDPAVAKLHADMAGLKSELQAERAQRTTALTETHRMTVDKFFSDPANIYAEELSGDMAALLKAGLCKDIASAYERALWANPAVRQKELTRQAAEKQAADKAAADQKLAASQAAKAANVRTQAKSGGTAPARGSMDDTLRETLDSIKSRA